MEHTTEGGQTHTRHDFSATITQQDLVDSYLFPFQSCVEKGKVSGLMWCVVVGRGRVSLSINLDT
jgi:pre-mRNA-splicing factor SYF2/beta-D-xylosidase 4